MVRGLARNACGSAGYSWTEAAQDEASPVAKRGLEGLLSASESFLHEGFKQVVAETAEAYLEGLKHQSNVRGRLQGRKNRTLGAKRGAQCRHSEQPQRGAKRDAQGSHSEQPKSGRGTRIGEKGSAPAVRFLLQLITWARQWYIEVELCRSACVVPVSGGFGSFFWYQNQQS